MSDVTEVDAGAQPDGGRSTKKGSKKLLLIGGAVAGLLVAAGGGAWVLMGSGMLASSEAETEVVAESYFYDLPEITVNLNTGGAAAEFLRLQIALELSSEAMVSEVEPRMARVLDAFQVYLRELRRSDLEGSAGIYRLKEELQRRVNLAIYPASVDDILFKQILIQ